MSNLFARVGAAMHGRTAGLCRCCTGSRKERGETDSLAFSDVEDVPDYGSVARSPGNPRPHFRASVLESFERLNNSFDGLMLRSKSQLAQWDTNYYFHKPLRKCVESGLFEAFMIGVVVANAFWLGVQIDQPNLVPPLYSHYVILAFNLLYTLEIVLKLWVYGYKAFFRSTYNWFALCVTAACWVELCINAAAEHSSWMSPGFQQYWRQYASNDLVQILQLGRVVRLGVVFPALGKLLDSIQGAIESIVWVVSLGLLVFFMSACCTTVFIGHRSFQSAALQDLAAHFDSIGHSMFTLLELALVEGWPSYVRPFTRGHWVYVPFLIGFIFIAHFFLLNLFTAVVVETVLVAHHERDGKKQEKANTARRQNAMNLYDRLRDLSQEEMGPDHPDTLADNVRLEDLKRWADHDSETINILGDIGWSSEYFSSIANCCDDEYTGVPSLRVLSDVVEDCGTSLNMMRFVKFEQHMTSRVDHMDLLCNELAKAMSALAKTYA